MFSNCWYIIKRVCHLLILCHNISLFMVSILHIIFWWPTYFMDTSLWMQLNEFIEFDEKLWKNLIIRVWKSETGMDWQIGWVGKAVRIVIHRWLVLLVQFSVELTLFLLILKHLDVNFVQNCQKCQICVIWDKTWLLNEPLTNVQQFFG